ncbi:hypothetical protein RND71_032162 [Anisodus tanguticus]|uniref:Uncharacterized protein n=1 Tax=Anisodus tanguticus TaxID=243964 RepID=A0AAE1REN5_9SOLA|nr:hypothetical protein RND71_032162 [Anisodus tanguticus]
MKLNSRPRFFSFFVPLFFGSCSSIRQRTALLKRRSRNHPSNFQERLHTRPLKYRVEEAQNELSRRKTTISTRKDHCPVGKALLYATLHGSRTFAVLTWFE